MHRHNVKGSLNEAVDLLEFSSRENNSNCPQSICVVQDLASTYCQKDGPAYTQERIAISLETLEKITPSWSCYDCISSEYISALVDAKKYDKALQEIKYRRAEMYKATDESVDASFCLDEVGILLKQGQFKKAENIIKSVNNYAAGDSFKRYKSAVTAITLAYQEKFDEAEKFVLPFTEVLKAQSHYLYWCEYKYIVCKHGLVEDFQELNYCFNTITKNFIKNGVQRDSLTVLAWHIELALLNHDIFTAQQCILNAGAIIPELTKNLGATKQFNGFQKKCEQAFQQFFKKNDLTEEKINKQLQKKDTLSLDYLNLAINLFPDNAKLQLALFDALIKNGYIQFATELALKTLNKGIHNLLILRRYGQLLLDENKYKEFDLFFQEEKFIDLNQDIRLIYLWFAASRFHQSDVFKSLSYLERILIINPKAKNCLIKIANICAQTEQYNEAKDYWTQLIEIDKENLDFHWNRMISSTILKDWKSVRESCKALNFKLESDNGIINQKMETIRLNFREKDGNTFNILATRIGPVEAIVNGLRDIEKEQFIGSTVVFDPSSLNSLNQKDNEGYDCDEEGYYTYLYPVFKVTEKQDYFVFDIDGVHPGEKLWDEFKKIIDDLGVILSVRYVEDYKVTKEGSEDELDAIYSFIACPSELDLKQLNNIIKQWIADNNLIFVWPLLLEKIDDVEELKKQAVLEDMYGLN